MRNIMLDLETLGTNPASLPEGWNEWAGDTPPYSGEVEVKLRSGNVHQGHSNNFYWSHDGEGSDIVAWRPVKIKAPTSPLDVQVGGGHYKDFEIQPVEFITRNKLGFLEGCVIKRICRFRAKNGREDLEKIKHEIDLLIELEYGRQT